VGALRHPHHLLSSRKHPWSSPIREHVSRLDLELGGGKAEETTLFIVLQDENLQAKTAVVLR
jgi:hypothetical protein